ncbi:right-handed parallel beta-helix repeat-containing protein [Prevotella brevis]|uniref:Right-handed parallel beta-helix repeat-containing protein n=1 Tax=Xylanibacter brevis TaxID=83231 RepID=A0ABS9CGS8_9BACT|nr:right-handed parallel beta-helix repeat-containing protein [Xylanibacter brevis]MCF2564196.1 right-handed parallel beta-helix repeat-containing protein [Xylanibacter brevis]
MGRLKFLIILFVILIIGAIPIVNASRDHIIEDNKAFSYSRDSVCYNLSKYYKAGAYYIQDTVDLQGKTWYLPSDITLVVKKGFIKNGIIIGKKTRLHYTGAIFDNVHIEGDWIVPSIKTSMFSSLDYENSLKDVFAFANPEVQNELYIAKGHYYVTAKSNKEKCLIIGSNTKVTIDGDIHLKPNDLEECSIIYVSGNNIQLSGKGTVFGDKHCHKGIKGEWGMGLFISSSCDVNIDNLKIKDCWGDCIYITKNSRGVMINNCSLDHGRRQGVSVISGDNVFIENCTISNVGGTSPQYAIDIEPNEGDSVGRVYIKNVNVINCCGGFMCYGKATASEIGFIEIRNCNIRGAEFSPMSFNACKRLKVDNNTVEYSTGENVIVCDEISDLRVSRNTIFINKKIQSIDKAIVVDNTKRKTINRNLIKVL